MGRSEMPRMGRGARLGRGILQGLGIALSILIAFGIEAWWDERGDRVREEEAIRQLTAEFEVIEGELARLDSADTVGRSGTENVSELLLAMGMDRGSLSDLRLDSLIAAAIGNPRVFVPEGVLSSVLASGDLALLRSDSLRVALSGWAPYRAEILSDVRYASDFNTEFLLPYLFEQVPVRTIDVRTGYHEELGPSPFPYDPWPLLSDRHFENLINERMILLETNAQRLGEARAHVGTVLRLLRQPGG